MTRAVRRPPVTRRAIALALQFVREHTPESCTRLCALLCCITGCLTALGTLGFAFTYPRAAPTVGALVGGTSALIAAGCVALLTRSRNGASDTQVETQVDNQSEVVP